MILLMRSPICERLEGAGWLINCRQVRDNLAPELAGTEPALVENWPG